jgi:hypothetical protein
VNHATERYANSRVEASQQATRQRARYMRRFKSVGQAQRFLSLHGVIQSLFRAGGTYESYELSMAPLALLRDLAECHGGVKERSSDSERFDGSVSAILIRA